MTDWIAKLSREIARPLRRKGAVDKVPLDFSQTQNELLKRVEAFCMTSRERIAVLISAVEYLVTHTYPGVFVECGVAQGGSCMTMAYALISKGETSRDIYLYDTFEGMPEPGEHDRGRFGESGNKAWRSRGGSNWIRHGIEEVRTNMMRTGYPADRLHFIKGKVEETLPARAPAGEIALLRLDTDWYDSTRIELEVLFPKLVKGGVILIDDYHRWQGARKAVDEYFARQKIPMFWVRIDDSAVVAVKT